MKVRVDWNTFEILSILPEINTSDPGNKTLIGPHQRITVCRFTLFAPVVNYLIESDAEWVNTLPSHWCVENIPDGHI